LEQALLSPAEEVVAFSATLRVVALFVIAPSPCSFLSLNLSFSLLLSLQFLSRAVALLYHCSIEPG